MSAAALAGAAAAFPGIELVPDAVWAENTSLGAGRHDCDRFDMLVIFLYLVFLMSVGIL